MLDDDDHHCHEYQHVFAKLIAETSQNVFGCIQNSFLKFICEAMSTKMYSGNLKRRILKMYSDVFKMILKIYQWSSKHRFQI